MSYKHSSKPVLLGGSIGGRLPFRSAVLAVAALLATGILVAQSTPTPSAAPSSAKATKPSPRHRAQAAAAQSPAPAEQLAPAAPPPPDWPVNDVPNKAAVIWDNHGLHIDASNSSLHQILNEVAAETGAKVEGMGADERIFGEYGPGEAQDVISQLLHGSSYNVLMIGDQGSGTPREIVLSARRSGNPGAGANRPNQETQDEDAAEQPEAEDQPVQPQPLMNRPPMIPQGPPGAPRTPQQVLQELQQRQQQMQDQQQQQQQQQQQPPH